MPVITNDIELTVIKRESAFEWLQDPENHARILRRAFMTVRQLDKGIFELTLAMPGHVRTLGYEMRGADKEHSGRRVLVEITGNRMSGNLHFSFSLLKGSTGTLVTLHLDYDTGGTLGSLLDSTLARPRMDEALKQVLKNLKREIEADFSGKTPSPV
jgi:carbon monoxide dehydrogenase subunit G